MSKADQNWLWNKMYANCGLYLFYNSWLNVLLIFVFNLVEHQCRLLLTILMINIINHDWLKLFVAGTFSHVVYHLRLRDILFLLEGKYKLVNVWRHENIGLNIMNWANYLESCKKTFTFLIINVLKYLVASIPSEVRAFITESKHLKLCANIAWNFFFPRVPLNGRNGKFASLNYLESLVFRIHYIYYDIPTCFSHEVTIFGSMIKLNKISNLLFSILDRFCSFWKRGFKCCIYWLF